MLLNKEAKPTKTFPIALTVAPQGTKSVSVVNI